jgi:hypothetical protein
MDESLFNNIKLCPLENAPHWKPKYNGAIERIISEKSDGGLLEVDQHIINNIKKNKSKFLNLEKNDLSTIAHISDINFNKLMNWWIENHKYGNRHNIEIALSSFLRKKGFSLEDSTAIFKQLYDKDSGGHTCEDALNILEDHWNKEPSKLAVMMFLKQKSSNDAQQIFDELKKCFVLTTTTTSNYPTTSYYNPVKIKSWGLISGEIVIEQINPNLFIYNKMGKKGLVQVIIDINPKTHELDKCLKIDNETYFFQNSIQEAKYNTPSIELCEKWVKGEFIPRSFDKIMESIQQIVLILYDFKNKNDLVIIKLAIGQSYLLPILGNVFYLGIDATKGGGKTTLLEILTYLQRHGWMGGDTSAAAIPRIVDELQLSVGIDELDQKIGNTGESDVVSLLRKGQRKNNPYTRCEGRNNVPKSYDCFGSHSFTYRTELEDAILDRTLQIHTCVAKDNTLPVINIFKEQLLKPLADELFLWAIENILLLKEKYDQTSSDVVSVVTCSNTLSDQDTDIIRKKLFDEITKNLTSDEIQLIKKFTGRNTELTFLALNVTKLLDINISNSIGEVMEFKHQNDMVSESYYLEALIDKLVKIYTLISGDVIYLKKDGIHNNRYFYPKNMVYQEFMQDLTSKNIHPIGTKNMHHISKT